MILKDNRGYFLLVLIFSDEGRPETFFSFQKSVEARSSRNDSHRLVSLLAYCNVDQPPLFRLGIAMEALLDSADALAAREEPDLPDFGIPEAFDHLQDPSDFLDLRDSQGKGKGWFATKDLPAGTHILVAKPIAMILDWENEPDDEGQIEVDGETPEDAMQDSDALLEDADDDDEDEDLKDEEEPEPRLNQMLLLDILEGLQDKPNFWFDQLTNMFPRDDHDLNALPAWVCPDDSMFMQVEAALAILRSGPHFCKEVVTEMAKRLPHIIRYNILSVETCPELLSYPGPGGHTSLSGVGLYYLPSFFNHSSRPNCSRWAIGDVMFFVTNQPVKAGEELCISYIEHDVLCESPFRRNRMLRMDFNEPDDGKTYPPQDDGPEMPVVDPDVQNELMMSGPLERLTSIEELLQQAKGEKAPEEEDDDMDVTNSPADGWFQCDVHNLRILQAITLESLGQTKKALEVWEQAVQFCQENLPPADEGSVVVRIQAALCALHAGNVQRASEHAQAALQMHNILFGGGVAWFRRRCKRDLELTIRPTSKAGDTPPVDILWPLGGN